ncbi:MAG: Uma2 family endonuclease, partial [Chloroflexi bacterium]|nr:Uma2 family endonuclease [Chloroflexota bacterium]
MTTRAAKAVFYPERDGKPIGETPVHRDELIRLIRIFQDRYAEREDVYVSGNMMFYWVEGNPRFSAAPDVFVVFGVSKLPERRVFKVWDEATPAVVIEITSRSTRREDVVRKKELYQSLGIPEYILYDPLAEYLRPPLQGYRLTEGVYVSIGNEDASLVCEELGVRLVAEHGRIRVFDQRTGEELLDPETRALIGATQARIESERARIESERAEVEARRADTERARAEAERARADAEAAA